MALLSGNDVRRMIEKYTDRLGSKTSKATLPHEYDLYSFETDQTYKLKYEPIVIRTTSGDVYNKILRNSIIYETSRWLVFKVRDDRHIGNNIVIEEDEVKYGGSDKIPSGVMYKEVRIAYSSIESVNGTMIYID